jgi:ribosomal protein S6-L-glutamate ligase RimK-like protein
MIVLWGLGSERTLTAVAEALRRRGTPGRLIDQGEVAHTAVRLDVGPRVRGSVWTRSATIDLEAVTAAYVRPYDSRRLAVDAGATPGDEAWRHALAVDDALASWSELTPALVVNRLGAMAGNSSKPYQLQQIARLGFRVPETLVTTDPRQARAFWERHGTVVYKSVSGVRSRVARLRARDRARLDDVATCPTQFQEFVDGRDHRVHVVGTEVFAATIACNADDYRYARGRPVEIRACALSPEMEDRCRRLAHALDLPVAGIDLRRRCDGAWYCFEVNPSPAFVFYEEATRQPIADAVARLLATSRPRCYDARRRV